MQMGAVLIVQVITIFDDGKHDLAAVGHIDGLVHHKPAALNLSAEVESHEMKCISAGLAVQLAAC